MQKSYKYYCKLRHIGKHTYIHTHTYEGRSSCVICQRVYLAASERHLRSRYAAPQLPQSNSKTIRLIRWRVISKWIATPDSSLLDVCVCMYACVLRLCESSVSVPNKVLAYRRLADTSLWRLMHFTTRWQCFERLLAVFVCI